MKNSDAQAGRGDKNKSDDKELILDFLILESALIWSTLSKGEDTAAAVCSSANGKTDMGIYEFI